MNQFILINDPLLMKEDDHKRLFKEEIRRKSLEKEKTVLVQNLDSKKMTPFDFQTALENILNFVKNPSYYWKNGNADTKKIVLKLCFQDYLYYSEKFGFQTPNYSVPFKLFRSLSDTELPLVEMGGVAPPSSWNIISQVFQTENIVILVILYQRK